MKLSLIAFFVALFCNSCMSKNISYNICSVAECINNGNDNLTSVVLCNECMKNVLSNSVAAHQFHGVQRELVIRHHYHRIKLADLNADVLFLIFDQLEIGDLLNLLTVYPDGMFSAIANDIYRRKYKDYDLFINNYTTLDTTGVGINKYSNNSIVVGEKAPLFLFFFGGLVQNLNIVSAPNYNIQYVNKYAEDSSTKFDKFDLKYINRCLPSLEHLSIR